MGIITQKIKNVDNQYISLTDIIFYLQYSDGEFPSYSEVARFLKMEKFEYFLSNHAYMFSEHMNEYEQVNVIYDEEGEPSNVINPVILYGEETIVPRKKVLREVLECLDIIQQHNILYFFRRESETYQTFKNHFNLYTTKIDFEDWLSQITPFWSSNTSLEEFLVIKNNNPQKYLITLNDDDTSSCEFHLKKIDTLEFEIACLNNQIKELQEELKEFRNPEQVAINSLSLFQEELEEYKLIQSHRRKAPEFDALIEILKLYSKQLTAPKNGLMKDIRISFNEKAGLTMDSVRGREAAKILQQKD